jgi:hypothetical protein
MILLTIGIAILDEHTRLARLQTNAPCNAAIGTAVGRRIASVHGQIFFKSGGDEQEREQTCCFIEVIHNIIMTTGNSRSRRSSTSVLSTLTYKDASSSSSSSSSSEEEEEEESDNDNEVVVVDSNSDDDDDRKKSRNGKTKSVGMTSSVASTAKISPKTTIGIPSDAKIKAQIEEMIKSVDDVETMSTKQFILALSSKYNNGVNLGSKKEFIKATIVNLLTKKTSKTSKITLQSSAAKSSMSTKNKVTKMTAFSTWDEDDDDDDDDDDKTKSSLNNDAVSGAMSAKSSNKIVKTNEDEGFDIVIPYTLLNKHTGSGKNECTMLVQVNNDDNNQHHLDFHGQSGAIGRFETSATNNNVNDTNNNNDGGIILDLQGYQYNGTIHPGPTAMIVALGRDGKFKVEAITDEYVTLNTTSRTDVMAKLNAVVLHQGEGGDDMSYYDGDDNVNVVRRKQSGGGGRSNGDNKNGKKKKEEEHEGDTDDDDYDNAADANGNVKHGKKTNKRKPITKNSGVGGDLAKKKMLVSVAKKKA